MFADVFLPHRSHTLASSQVRCCLAVGTSVTHRWHKDICKRVANFSITASLLFLMNLTHEIIRNVIPYPFFRAFSPVIVSFVYYLRII